MITVAYALSPDGLRAYILQVDGGFGCQVRAFNLRTSPGAGAQFPEIISGFPINLADCPGGSTTRIVINPPGDTLFIAGNRSIDPISSTFLLPQPNDGKVSVARTKLAGMSAQVVVGASHPTLVRRKAAIEQTIAFLRSGHFT